MLRVIFFALALAGTSAGQPSTNASCSASFAWADNSRGQSPCLVAAYLGSVCNSDGLFIVPGLATGGLYEGPTLAQANACGCSSVFYSLLGACADCQSADIQPWSKFNENCNTVYPQIFVGNIPPGTAVPHWAYQNVTAEDGFNSTLAQTQLDAPESTANAQPTSTALPSGPSATSSKKTNAGAIAGGVVGGVVLLAVIAAVALWFIRRRRDTASSSIGPTDYHSTGDITPFPLSPQKPYNPSDPTTFPSSPSSPSSAMYNSNRVQSPVYSEYTMTELPRVQYSGAAEI
ncbi:hypothetical protein DFH06DRAFT_425574 [Mycena polygramma]|nr:hypothetical protein DFH06DRAFT_425574 [Mycena polygramma]